MDQKVNTCPECGCVGLRYVGEKLLHLCLLCRKKYLERKE